MLSSVKGSLDSSGCLDGRNSSVPRAREDVPRNAEPGLETLNISNPVETIVYYEQAGTPSASDELQPTALWVIKSLLLAKHCKEVMGGIEGVVEIRRADNFY